ncbi:hypothetical protein GALMADRAFT_218479 [Galerina marginata CBS 339.88]|uniref:Uncharacterized protein n=1 Tax=Galerina marginata (strain CBS 339.88) TaxID=685588 RepID=A0A067TSU1_GALM3|nr:hypothetical protein GALMADRAFT_218479 [Galerina marginata CBS 339.88]
MDPRRPRASILSLFDPLSGSPHSSVDKENDAGDSSFFQPAGMTLIHNPVQPYLPTFKRRLVDVGDMTIDEPEMHDLLADEDELQDALHQNLAEDDDNDTLTFRDMAKAATPKWSERRAATMATPKSSPTPRTPLAEIAFKEETTPMARKKAYKRTGMSVALKLADLDYAQPQAEKPSSLVPPNLCNIIHSSSLPLVSPPMIEVSFDEPGLQITPETSGPSGLTLGSSVGTLNLPTPTESLIADTSIPVLISPPSPYLSPIAPTLQTTRLRANPPPNDRANRYSVDLQSSFQLHLNSSETTFDLLNEKISFFNTKDGIESFLNNLEIDDSFGDEDFEEIKSLKGTLGKESRAVRAMSPPKTLENVLPVTKENIEIRAEDEDSSPLNQVKSVLVPELLLKATTAESITGHSPISVQRIPTSSGGNGLKAGSTIVVEEDRAVPISIPVDYVPCVPERRKSLLSTPRFSSVLQHPPRQVPALKIVKRSRLVAQSNSNVATTTNSRRSSIVPGTRASTSRTDMRSSPEAASTSTINGNKQVDGQLARGLKKVVPVQPSVSASTSGDGPRRVLISEGPKLNSVSNSRTALDHTKSSSTITGPRRIMVAAPVVEKAPSVIAKPTAQASSGLKQPVKYATAGPSSAIPKPIARAAGTKLPGPPSSTARFGVPTSGLIGSTKGLLGRRVT